MTPFPDLIATLNSMVEEHEANAASLSMEAIGGTFDQDRLRDARDAVIRYRTLCQVRDLVVHAQRLPTPPAQLQERLRKPR